MFGFSRFIQIGFDRATARNAWAGTRAFTLIELLVVISIIALLISLLLPALQGARAAARSAECLGRMRQLTIAVASYHADNGYYPLNVRSSSLKAGGSYQYPSDFLQQVGPYTHPGQVNYTEGHQVGNVWGRDRTAAGNFYLCPDSGYRPTTSATEVYLTAAIWNGWRVANYTMNPFFGYAEFDYSKPFGGPQKRDVTDSPSRVPLIGEQKRTNRWGMDAFHDWMLPDSNRAGLYVHPAGTTNAAFLDGSAANQGDYDDIMDGWFSGRVNWRPENYY